MAESNYAADEGIVYFFGWPRRRIKIGHTINPAMRLRTLRFEHAAWAANFLATTPGGRDVERAYHERFAEHRHGKSEWFEPHPDILAEVARLNAEVQG